MKPRNVPFSMGSMLPDEEIDNATKFGFDDYSTALISIITDKKLQTPFTIAIHGDWGSGKTSLMRTIAKGLESKERKGVKIKTIWFDAWEFEKLGVPLWTVFLNHILSELREMTPNENLKSKIKELCEGIMAVSVDLMLRKVTGLTMKDVKEATDAIWTDMETINSLRAKLSNQISQTLKKDPQKRERLIIFVDDLDRCLPEQAAEMFESIKLFLNCKNCVFVLGIDKEQISKAFEYKFKEGYFPAGLPYLEKFIQLQFDLPRKTPVEVSEFLCEHASDQLKKTPKTIELISRFIEPNPRKIKRWLNSVLFLETLFRVKQRKVTVRRTGKIDVSIVSIWIFLKSFFPEFATLIESDLSLFNKTIKTAKNDKDKIKDSVKDSRLADFLALLEPNYSDEQLREVVYLSKLTPSISEISERSYTMEEIKKVIPDTLKAILSFEEKGDYVVITPLQFLGAENFDAVATIVHAMNGEYVSSGKTPHFRVLRKRP